MTAETVLETARGEIGVRESPAGSNCVKYNTAYYGRAVSGGQYPWCCVFLWWVFRRAGCPALFYGGGRTASCGTLAAWARRQGRFVTGGYRAGDLVFFHFGGAAIRHIGIVEAVGPDGTMTTIEGNTGSGSDADGGQVQRRKRTAAQAAGAYRPAYEEETDVTQAQFNAMMDAWLTARAAEEPGDFSAQARAWAEGQGLIKGDGSGAKQYRSFCTREQMMVFLYRLSRLGPAGDSVEN